MKPSFYLDEHIPPVYAMELEKRGFAVLLATQSDRREKSDEDQLTYAIEKQAVVITHNLDDFGRLAKLVITSGGHHPGIIGISELNRHRQPRRIGEVIRKLVGYLEGKDSQDLQDTFQVI